MTKELEFRVTGTHCSACQQRIEVAVKALKGVEHASVDYASGRTTVRMDPDVVSDEQVYRAIRELGHDIAARADGPRPLRKTLLGVGLLALVALAAIAIDRSGALSLLARLNETNLSYPLILTVGLLASFHCVGMCGGLVVTYTASAQGQAGPWLPHLLYNLGRLLSYVAVGAILGAFGSFFGIRPAFSGALTLVVGVLMTGMGLALLTEWSWLRGASTGPLSRVAALLFSGAASARGPFVIGLLNGLMPCGPLQAMQLYALSSGSALKGGLSMGAYALGTIPLMLGFGRILSLVSRDRVQAVVRLSGALVMVLGLLMIGRGWVSLSGAASPSPVAVPQPTATREAEHTVQTVTMYVTSRGYEPNTFEVKAGVPVRWVIVGQQISRCTDEIILHGFDIRQKLKVGTTVIEFTPTTAGVIRFSCWMQMVWGRFIVS